jgi:F-type H+-transporting ATPase subunit b
LKQLGLDLGLFLSQIVNFGLLLGILYVLLYKPILSKLEERAKKIKKGIDDAEQAEQLRADAGEFYQQEIERARREAHEIIERATLSAEQQRAEILSQAR